MKEFISAMAVRIFAGGIICSVAMIIAGDGAKKEVVRLCCACLMIVFVLSPVKGASFSLAALTEGSANAEAQINAATQESRAYERNSVASAVGEYIRGQATALDITARAHVDYSVDGDNIFRITGITVVYSPPAEHSALDLLRQIIARDCGVSESQIVIVEEVNDEN